MKTQKKPPELMRPDAAKIPELEAQIQELEREADRSLALCRAAMVPFAETWMRDEAKAVAVQQDEHTVRLGRKGILEVKTAIHEHAEELRGPIEEEFTSERYARAADASSGQVRTLIARRFDLGFRRILATLYPLLERFGYKKDAQWGEPGTDSRPAYPVSLDVPADIRDHIRRIIDALTQGKVCEAKIAYYKKLRGKEIASEIWDSV